MERRYLVAALAIIATFTVTSRGFRTLEHLSVVRAAHAEVFVKSRCQSSSAAQALAKIGTRLRPRFPEEAQLLAEMNAPLVNVQSTIAEQMARQDAAIARCARERAMRDAERAYRDAMRAQQSWARSAGYFSVPPAPISVSAPDVVISPPAAPSLPPDIAARMRDKAAAIAARVAASNMKLQMAADKLGTLQNMEIPAVEVSDDGGNIVTHVHVHTNTRCKAKVSSSEQRQPE
jgi:hypothetical protein